MSGSSFDCAEISISPFSFIGLNTILKFFVSPAAIVCWVVPFSVTVPLYAVVLIDTVLSAVVSMGFSMLSDFIGVST